MSSTSADTPPVFTDDSSSLTLEKVEPDDVSRDPGKWTINENTIERLLSKDINQNMEEDFSSTRRFFKNINKHRSLTRDVFKRKLANGETQERKFLIFSPSKKMLFCIPCRLFGGTSKLATEGYDDWSNVSKVVGHHECSQEHNQCQIKFYTRSTTLARIDSTLKIQIENEINYWRSVLRYVIAVIKKLSSRGLPFRGEDERFGSKKNGNFLMCLELISEFDPFISNHIAKYGNPGSGRTSYLSSTICDEFISLLASKVAKTIMDEMKASKYFSIIVDSTPDISHIDELSLIIRYIKKGGYPVERFIKFLPHIGHTSENMEEAVISTLSLYNINLNDMRGQSYDNAANMAGAYNGLQARIIKRNPLAFFVPCGAHSMQLVLKSSVENILPTAKFFDSLQNLYEFFAASTRRWEVLTEALKKGQSVVKRVTGTRWSSRYDAVSSFINGWSEVLQALENFEDDLSAKGSVRCEAAGLRKALSRFESVFIAIFWNELLERFEKTNKTLQAVDMNLGVVVDLYKSLVGFVDDLRTDDKFNEFIDKSKEKTEEEYEQDTVRRRKRKLLPGEAKEIELVRSGKDKLKAEVYFAVLDRLSVELKKRMSAYTDIHQKFNFLLNIINESTEDISHGAKNLQNIYNSDIEEGTFENECIHFKNFLLNMKEEELKSHTNLLALLHEYNLCETFPNVTIALRIFLSMASTNCSAERSFSALKRLKNYLRASIGQEKLNSLAVLSIEASMVENIDFNDVIEEFAARKSRRKPMSFTAKP